MAYQITLTKYQLRIWLDNVDNPQVVMDNRDRNTLNRLRPDIERSMQPYIDEVDKARRQTRLLVRESGYDPNYVQTANTALTIHVEDIDEELGDEEITLVLDDGDFEYMKEKWLEISKKHQGGKHWRKHFTAINLAIVEAVVAPKREQLTELAENGKPDNIKNLVKAGKTKKDY